MRVFFSVGEPSGDLHGANLARSLRDLVPTVRLEGFGGPRMQAAGVELHTDLTERAVIGFSRVIAQVPRFYQLLQQADDHFRNARPDAVVLIDYPGFNWWVARRAQRYGIPVFYYGVPQLWAWAAWRIRKMRRLVDHVLCKLPFEAEWYARQGCQATYVGHPYFDQLEREPLDPAFVQRMTEPAGPLVAILPGSRQQEVQLNLPWFLKTAQRIRAEVPAVRFAIASYNAAQAGMAQQLVRRHEVDAEIHVGRTPELIHASRCCLACSGSVSLELLFHTKPAVVHYWSNRLLFWLARRFLVTVRYVTLVNLLACEDRFELPLEPYDPDSPRAAQVPYPEYPTCTDKTREMTRHIVGWLNDEASRERVVVQLEQLKRQLCHGGASQTAARYLVEQLNGLPARRWQPAA